MGTLEQFDIWTFLAFFIGIAGSLALEYGWVVKDWFAKLSSTGKFLAVLIACLLYAFFKAVGHGELADGVMTFVMLWTGATVFHLAFPGYKYNDPNDYL